MTNVTLSGPGGTIMVCDECARSGHYEAHGAEVATTWECACGQRATTTENGDNGRVYEVQCGCSRQMCQVKDSGLMFDMSELGEDDDRPISLTEFLAINEECPPDASEVAELRACLVGATVKLGIGGGFVTVTRVA